jgi:(E)-4-hydroxy-3-methylbut-2-enyl-diphosphate synthase
VNAGSLDKDLLERHGSATPEAMVESALTEIRYLEEVDFTAIKISVKHSNVPTMVAAYRLLADRVDYPLHLGVTEAGPPPGGLIKSVAGIATLLLEGIGDTIRFSLTADPVEEAKAGRQLLEYLGMRERSSLDLIACPSCGRAEVDVIEVAEQARIALEAEDLPVQVAVMGCVVNGPGEAREADIGIAAGRGKGHLFIKGKVVRVVPEDEMVPALLDEARRLAAEGIDARLAAADDAAEQIAAEAAEELLAVQGDANRVAARRAAVAQVAGE